MGAEIQKSSADNLGDFLKANKGKMVSALNDSIQFERFATVAMNTVRRTPGLLQCSASSIITAVQRSAELGLEPGSPLGHAYLVPYKEECQFIIGYRGYLHLMYRSGGLKDGAAHIVYENDKFTGRRGTDPYVEHLIGFGKRGKPIGAYCVLRYSNGGLHVESMNMDELNAVQAMSRAKSGPWIDWPDEMRRKTVLRRAAKWGPTGDGLEIMAKAHEYDDDTIDSVATPVAAPSQQPPSLASENGVGHIIDATDRLKQAIPEEPGSTG